MSSEYRYVPMYGRRRGSRRQYVFTARLMSSVRCIFNNCTLCLCGVIVSYFDVFTYIMRGLRVVGSITQGNARASIRGTAIVGLHAFFVYLSHLYTTHPIRSPWGNKTFVPMGKEP